MHYTSELLSEMHRMVEDQAVPNYRKRDRQRLAERLTLNNSEFESLVEDLANQTAPKNKGYYADNLSHWTIILLNFCRSTIMRQWCGISGDTASHKPGGMNHYIGLTNARRTAGTLKALENEKLVIKIQGKNYHDQPHVNLYWPTQPLRKALMPFGLLAETPWVSNDHLIRIKQPTDQFKHFRFRSPNKDYEDICAINEFMREQTWACKGPITWPFKYTPFQSGRLITPFQNLPSKNYKIRINTKINGESISEVDCNASHLRIFLAFHKTAVVGDWDAYQPIAHEARLPRNIVKKFVTLALNTSSFEQAARASLKHHDIELSQSTAIDQGFKRVYPNLNLYSQFGLVAMQIEGVVMNKLLSQAIQKQVAVIPVHDAICFPESADKDLSHIFETLWQQELDELSSQP